MRRVFAWTAGAVALALLLAACGADADARPVAQGDVLLTQTFDAPGVWEEGTFPPDAATPESVLGVEDGRYVIDHTAEGSASFTWGAGGPDAEDVIITVQAAQLSDENDNLYGVGCRLVTDENGNASGYVLLISGDGHFAIAELSRGSLDFLLGWRQSEHIRQGRSENTLRATCVGNTLALEANGEFLGAVEHDAFRRPGQVALVAGVSEGGRVRVAFDDLAVYAGALEQGATDGES